MSASLGSFITKYALLSNIRPLLAISIATAVLTFAVLRLGWLPYDLALMGAAIALPLVFLDKCIGHTALASRLPIPWRALFVADLILGVALSLPTLAVFGLWGLQHLDPATIARSVFLFLMVLLVTLLNARLNIGILMLWGLAFFHHLLLPDPYIPMADIVLATLVISISWLAYQRGEIPDSRHTLPIYSFALTGFLVLAGIVGSELGTMADYPALLVYCLLLFILGSHYLLIFFADPTPPPPRFRQIFEESFTKVIASIFWPVFVIFMFFDLPLTPDTSPIHLEKVDPIHLEKAGGGSSSEGLSEGAGVIGWFVVTVGPWFWVELGRMKPIRAWRKERLLVSRLPIASEAIARDWILAAGKSWFLATTISIVLSVGAAYLLGSDKTVKLLLYSSSINGLFLTMFAAILCALLIHGFSRTLQIVGALAVTFSMLVVASFAGIGGKSSFGWVLLCLTVMVVGLCASRIHLKLTGHNYRLPAYQ